LSDFARISSAYSINDINLQQKSQALRNAINNSVIANYHHVLHPNSYGLSYYFQPSKKLYQQYHESDYTNTTAYSRPIWKSFLQEYYQRENISDSPPYITDFSVSAKASLARPVKFSYQMTGANIVKNQWAQFYQEGNTWKLARLIGQRAVTKLPDGSEVYGYSDGTSYGIGRSLPVEFGISDGTKTVKASIEQRWPAEDAFVANGIIKKKSGEQFEAQIFFSSENGYAVKALGLVSQNGKQFLSPVLVEDGDKFVPYIYTLSQDKLVPQQGTEITYTNANGFELSWNVLDSGIYLVADVATDLEGKTGMVTGQFSVEKQPPIVAPTEAELKTDWNCGVLNNGLRVDKILSLSLANNLCLFQDGTGTYNCTVFYSQEGDPHIYLHNVEKRETYKFVVSKRGTGSIWLYELAGTDPVICAARGSSQPSVSFYKELYQSVGDGAKDVDEIQTGTSGLAGTWEDQKTNMQLKLNNDMSFEWKISKSTISGKYSADNDYIYLNALSPSSSYSTTFTYVYGKKRMVLYDSNLVEISLKKSGTDINASNEPVLQTSQSSQSSSQPSPQATTSQQSLVGVWVNNNLLLVLWLKADGTYEYSNGYLYTLGVYSVSGNKLIFQDIYGTVNQYPYTVNSNELDLIDQGVTVPFYKYQD
ncbi:MAG: hypothetical protein ABID61_05555, partial [Candidatus Micrarchaeota archaeon]